MRRHFLVCCTVGSNQRYDIVEELLRTWGALRIVETTTWLLSLDASAHQVRDALATMVDRGDTIVVVELAPDADWATIDLSSAGNAWFKERLRLRHDLHLQV